MPVMPFPVLLPPDPPDPCQVKPTIHFNNLANGQAIPATSLPYLVTGYVDPPSGRSIISVYLAYWSDGFPTEVPLVDVIPGGPRWEWEYSLTLDQFPVGGHSVTIVATDSEGCQKSEPRTFSVV